MAGAAEYEKARGEKGTATEGMDAQSLAHIFVAICIVLGNVVRRGQKREASHERASGDIGVWIAALLTLCIFSFLYKDNPFYKFAEHLFVGVSAGYFIILNFWTVIVPNLVRAAVPPSFGRGAGGAPPADRPACSPPELGDYRGCLLIPALLGVLLFTRLFGKHRLAVALVAGGDHRRLRRDQDHRIRAGRLRRAGAGEPAAAVDPATRGDTFNAIVFTVGLITSLLFFFFSREHKGALGVASRVGIVFLMIGFGAGYGYTVMSRISLLIGRFQFLLETWLGLG